MSVRAAARTRIARANPGLANTPIATPILEHAFNALPIQNARLPVLLSAATTSALAAARTTTAKDSRGLASIPIAIPARIRASSALERTTRNALRKTRCAPVTHALPHAPSTTNANRSSPVLRLVNRPEHRTQARADNAASTIRLRAGRARQRAKPIWASVNSVRCTATAVRKTLGPAQAMTRGRPASARIPPPCLVDATPIRTVATHRAAGSVQVLARPASLAVTRALAMDAQ